MRLLPAIIAMATIVVASNILVQFLLLDGLLTWGAFTYPFAFLVTDIANRLYGARAARQIIVAGLVVGIICSLIGTQIMLEYGPAVGLRVAIGSATAFLLAQLLDVAVFDRLRSGSWWRAPLVSTLVSSSIDTALFFTIAFSAQITLFPASANAAVEWAQAPAPLLMFGPEMPLWISLALADWAVKLTIAMLALFPFRLLTSRHSQTS
ncbi:MAG: queuosine precursor transporter [Rhodobacteraceae bacterium]|nr:queuosine precursor transporter [Paracoccaceae bacterium]